MVGKAVATLLSTCELAEVLVRAMFVLHCLVKGSLRALCGSTDSTES